MLFHRTPPCTSSQKSSNTARSHGKWHPVPRYLRPDYSYKASDIFATLTETGIFTQPLAPLSVATVAWV